MAWACKRILRQLPNGSGGPLTPATREPSNGAGLMGYPTSRSSALLYRNRPRTRTRPRSLNVAPKNRFRQKTTNQPTASARKIEDDVSEGSSLCICGAPRRQRSKIEDEEGVSEGSSLCICGAPRRQRSKIEDERRRKRRLQPLHLWCATQAKVKIEDEDEDDYDNGREQQDPQLLRSRKQ